MKTFFFFLFPLLSLSVTAQSLTQTIRGVLVDKDSQMPLAGAHVYVERTVPVLGVITDADGAFVIDNVPVGRQTLVATYLGYEPMVLPDLMIISGKEQIVTIELTESLLRMDEVVIKADADKSRPLNEMAIVSARMFSVEETSRYAGSMFDPARMALNFAGVSVTGGSTDLFNEIIVRGNSPRGVLWRLEGIEIPNPNHFGALGNTGGGISMLSSSTLSTSDFYTGAFPAEFGNAVSGAFDLNLRKGNSAEREYAVMVGALGVEVALEGPFSHSGEASYLFNLRYSTLSILKSAGINVAGDALPEYGDISFNISLPTKSAGAFSLFGLGGKNRSYFDPAADSTQWDSEFEEYGFSDRQTTGTIGLTHKLLLDDKSYIRTIAAASHEKFIGDSYFLDVQDNYRRVPEYGQRFENNTYRLNTSYTRKVSAHQTFKIGGTLSYQQFRFFADTYDRDKDEYHVYLQDLGNAHQLQTFIQWKHRLSETVTATSGLHFSYFGLNETWSVEPRLALRKTIRTNQSLDLAIGLHSKPEHPSFYYAETSGSSGDRESPNKDLRFTKSGHAVLGYEYRFSNDFRFRAETYFQYLFDVPVSLDPSTNESILNAIDIWDVLEGDPAVNKGRGRNIGLDLTVEKNFSQNFYFMIAASVFDSKYRALNRQWYNTRFNSNYQVNVIGGKEWKKGPKSNRIWAVNGKVLLNGGNRMTPVNLEESILKGEAVYFDDRPYSEFAGTYYRLDLMASHKINRPKVTHTFMIDIQNVTNRQNLHSTHYDEDKAELVHFYQTGILPVFNYRLEF
jgi:hypothetical protein